MHKSKATEDCVDEVEFHPFSTSMLDACLWLSSRSVRFNAGDILRK
jgi:hypothetical protein